MLNIALVSDFFYPNVGGVENHLYCLSQKLIERGHKVIIITHSYGNRKGIRWLSSGLKVYYLPHIVIYSQASLPTLFTLLPLFRYIFIRENIQIVHAHQAFSTFALESILHAKTMGLKVCFTDHSLFGFADTSSILTNKLLQFCLSDIDHVICVSYTSRENTVLRANLSPTSVSVIPNAVICSQFKPNGEKKSNDVIRIVVVSRLVYRKGMDLLIGLIPLICQINPKVRFLIAGDGPKRVDLEQMREKYGLHDQVVLLGAIQHSQVRDVLVQGHLFLNTSLTEAFCIAIVEAASAGLFVISTKVGGIPEVLPPHMISFAQPNVEDLLKAVQEGIQKIEQGQVHPELFWKEIADMYQWGNVAERTEKIYYSMLDTKELTLLERLEKYYACGFWAGKMFCLVVVVDYLFYCLLEWLFPSQEIEKAPNFPYSKLKSDYSDTYNDVDQDLKQKYE